MARPSIRYLSRGRVITLSGDDPGQTLLDHLRLQRRLTGTKEGCNEGDCGACTVVLARLDQGRVRYQPVNACILLAGQVDGAEVITVEDLGERDRLHPAQQAMVEHHGSQCGFCTPGIVMSLFSLYHEGARPVTRADVTDQLAGNLCRCTGYRPIIDAALAACSGAAADAFSAGERERGAALAALDDAADVFAGTKARFFAAPRTIETLSKLLAEHPDAVIVAGATDVGLWLTKKLRVIDKIVWIGRVRGLDAVTEDATALHLGATATLAEAASKLAALDPDLGAVMRRFGSAQVRASGTVGGNIANGSPIGDLAPCLIALDATLTLHGAGGERPVPLQDFFIAYGRQDRRPGEFVRMLTVPRLQAGQHFRAFKLSKRFEEDISAVMGAFRFTVDAGRIASARIAYGGMAATPKRAAGAEAALVGVRLDHAADWERAIAALSEDFSPLSDMRASAGYRSKGAGSLLRRALTELAGAPTQATRLIDRREAV
jgi:xanthine dehydrogenase small subunit